MEAYPPHHLAPITPPIPPPSPIPTPSVGLGLFDPKMPADLVVEMFEKKEDWTDEE